MPRRFSDRPVTPATTLNDETMNSLIVPLDRAIEALEGQVIDWQEQVDLFNSLGLKRISEAVQPLLDQINGAISGGLLVANTVDTVGFAEGDEIDLLITEQSRVTFQPTPFVMLTHASEINDWALCRVTNYVAQTGAISLEVLTLNGSGASRTGWIISASAGLASAILDAASAAQASANAAQQAAEDANAAAILIAGGPVSSVNGRAGVVTGLAEASDVAAALAAKADASAVTSALSAKADAATVAALSTTVASKADAAATTTALAGKASLSDLTGVKSFVATGTIPNGAVVGLRSDGTVEAISGTAVDPAVGSDTDGPSCVGANLVFAADFCEVTNKIAIAYGDQQSMVARIVIGTVSGTGISFGTDVTTNINCGTTTTMVVAWNQDGSKVAVAVKASSTAAIFYASVATVSGTVPTFGTQYFSTLDANSTLYSMIWDGAGGRIIIWAMAASGNNLIAGTVSGTVISFGTASFIQNLASGAAVNSTKMWFNDAASRLVVTARLSGGSSVNVAARPLSGTTWGTGASTASFNGTNSSGWSTAYDRIGDKVVVAQGEKLQAFSFTDGPLSITDGVAASIPISPSALTLSHRGAALAADRNVGNRFMVAVLIPSDSTNYGEGTGVLAYVATLSGTTFSFSAGSVIARSGAMNGLSNAVAFASGNFAVIFNDRDNFGYQTAILVKIVSGAPVLGNKFAYRPTSLLYTELEPLAVSGDRLIFFGKRANASKFATSYVVQMPVETGNAASWIGVAKAAASGGQSVPVVMKGQVAGGFSGLTVGASYYLKGDGTPTLVNNDRPLGQALSATEIRLAA